MIPSFDFSQEFKAKDFSIEKITKLKPHLNLWLPSLLDLVPNKKIITIDYFEQILTPGSFTCRRPVWHVDGVNNDYLIISWGDYLTKFSSLQPHSWGATREENMEIIFNMEQKLEDSARELANGEIIQYNSHSIHRGRKVFKMGKRVFLRICSSSYLEPRNQLF